MYGSKQAVRTVNHKTFKPMPGNWNATSSTVPFTYKHTEAGVRPYATSQVLSFTVNSGWITEEGQSSFEDLISSPSTFLLQAVGGDEVVANRILITSSSIQRKQTREDKNISVTIQYRLANTYES